MGWSINARVNLSILKVSAFCWCFFVVLVNNNRFLYSRRYFQKICKMLTFLHLMLFLCKPLHYNKNNESNTQLKR